MALSSINFTGPYGVCVILSLLLLQVALLFSTSADIPPPFAHSGTLQVLVPSKPVFQQFADCSGSSGSSVVQGFCIDVFQSALSILMPKPNWTDVKYTCYDVSSRTYDSMIDALSSESAPYYDAVVGDTTISATRLQNASFTHSFLDSGIVLLAPAVGVSLHFPGVFFAPFTSYTWVILIVSIVLTGLALWFIEHNDLQRSLLGSEQHKIDFWFVTSILVFSRGEPSKNPLAKFVTIAWRLFILLLGSSYTASLSSILTVNELSSEIKSIDELRSKNASVGYQVNSVVKDYLLRNNITKLVPLNNTDDYAKAIRTRQVAAIAEELPYVSLFLAEQSASTCEFLVGSKLTTEGFGLAFGDKNLSAAFSIAILNLSESGQIQRLKDGWKLSNFQCPSSIQSTRLDLKSSEGLFLLLASALFVCVVMVLLKHLVLPFCARAYARLRVDDQQDVIDAFWEPNFRRSITRWFSASSRHMAPEDYF